MPLPLRVECSCGKVMHLEDSYFVKDVISEKEITENKLPKNTIAFMYSCYSCGSSIKIYKPFELKGKIE